MKTSQALTEQAARRTFEQDLDAAEFEEAFVEAEMTFQRWPDTDGPWMLRLYWQTIDGRKECVGMKLSSMATRAENRQMTPHMQMPGTGIPLTTGVIRDIKIGEQIGEARKEMTPAPREVQRPPGLRESTFERLREAARVYQEAFASDGKPTTAVAAHFGLTVGGASNLVSRARDVGLLPPTSRGAPQG